MRVKMRTMGRGAQGPPAHLGSVDLVNCVRGWLRSLWSVSEEPASETGNYRTSCNCCKTGSHMRELMLLYGCWCLCESTVHVCETEWKSDHSFPGAGTSRQEKSCQTTTDLVWNLYIFDATNCSICKTTTLNHLAEINWSRSKDILPQLEINWSFFYLLTVASVRQSRRWPVYILLCSW